MVMITTAKTKTRTTTLKIKPVENNSMKRTLFIFVIFKFYYINQMKKISIVSVVVV